MGDRDIDLWFSVGSIYTYLTVMRIAEVEAKAGVRFRWRPFSIRTIMIEMDNRPMGKPAKLAYMWRDTQRRAQMYGHPFALTPPYPLPNFDLANSIAVVGAEEGWCADYLRAAYKCWFGAHDPAGSDRNNAESLAEIGQDAARVLQRAASPEIAAAYKTATDEARALGIFGVPSFVTRGEVFWGDDRLEDAVAWHSTGALAR
ncbi:MAG TPA: DsbA family protein [Pseudolabrys sp.]|nr:DsbA family protein [Pseudolabrys sp.]